MAKHIMTAEYSASQLSDEELWDAFETDEPEIASREETLEASSLLQPESLQQQWRILCLSLVIPPLLWLGLVAVLSILIVGWFVRQGWFHPVVPPLWH